MKNNWKLLAISLFLLILSSCTAKVPDIEACVTGHVAGYCNTTLSDKKRVVDLNYIREVGRVSMTPEAFGELKKFILEICERSKKCQREYSSKINTFLEENDQQ